MSAGALLLIGAGGHARACIDVLECGAQFAIAGLVGGAQEQGGTVLGYPVLGDDAALAALAQRFPLALVAVGQIASPALRQRLFARACALGMTLPAIISPRAQVSRHASIGPGTIVMHGAVVNAGAVVGSNCIINTRAVVEHDAQVGDHCHVSTGAILNGGVRLGEGSFVGSGSVVREALALGAGCVIGMGLAVRHGVPDGARVTGQQKQ